MLIIRISVKALIPKLQKLGHTVHNSTMDKASTNSAYLSQVVKSSNNSGAELVVYGVNIVQPYLEINKKLLHKPLHY